MNDFVSFASTIKKILYPIVEKEISHAKWLNTLSCMENCGARKIAACEHPTLVKEEVLKHAAEEFRHAHYLKKQIARVTAHPFDTYGLRYLLAGRNSIHYLPILDVKTSRYLSEALKLSRGEVKETAYLLVTYAIERRAQELYPIYDAILKEKRSKVTVKSILLEEEEHLKEMERGIELLDRGDIHAKYVCSIESEICRQWLQAIESEVFLHKSPY